MIFCTIIVQVHLSLSSDEIWDHIHFPVMHSLRTFHQVEVNRKNGPSSQAANLEVCVWWQTLHWSNITAFFWDVTPRCLVDRYQCFGKPAAPIFRIEVFFYIPYSFIFLKLTFRISHEWYVSVKKQKFLRFSSVLFIHQCLYRPLLSPGIFFIFVIFFTQTVGPLRPVISPSQGRYLHTGHYKHRNTQDTTNTE
jgi:hypothetical protein